MRGSTNERRRQLVAAVAALPLAGLAGQVLAQTTGWPEKPIRILLGYPPGGAADGTARPLEPKMQALLGRPLLFDYKPGAGATIAADMTSKAPPDGYTLQYVDSGPMTILPNGKKLNYDPFKSFTPIGMCCDGGTLLVAHPSVKANTVQELIAEMKAKPGEFTYGTSGIGGAGHLAAELFQAMSGTRMTHVPYKGGSQAVTDLVGGQVPLLFSSMATAIPHVNTGKIKAIAVTSSARASALPDVRTVAEQGLPNFEASAWFSLVGPAGLPPSIVEKVHAALNAALGDQAVQESIRKQGYEPSPSSVEGFARRIRADHEKWGKVIRDANISFS